MKAPDSVIASDRLNTPEAPLQLLRKSLWRLADERKPDAESVHQVRVNARRGRAIIELFGDRLGRKIAEDLDDKLKRLLRAGGKVRDADILAAKLDAEGGSKSDHHLSGLRDRLLDERSKALQDLLHRAGSRKTRKQLKRARSRMRAARSAAALDGDETLRPNLFPVVRAGKRLLDAMQNAQVGAAEQMHRVRVSIKKLRYLCDYCPELPDGVVSKDAIAILKAAQDVLGEANDLTNLARFLRPSAPSENLAQATALAALIQGIELRIDQLHRDFDNQLRQGIGELAARICGANPDKINPRSQPARPAV